MEPEKDILEQWREKREARSPIRKIIDRIYLWWDNEAQFYPKHFKQGIKNL